DEMVSDAKPKVTGLRVRESAQPGPIRDAERGVVRRQRGEHFEIAHRKCTAIVSPPPAIGLRRQTRFALHRSLLARGGANAPGGEARLRFCTCELITM